MDPSLSGILLYAENIALACGLLFVSVLFAFSKTDGMKSLALWEPETERGRFYTVRRIARWYRVNQTRIGLFLLFFFGAMSYAVSGVYSALGISMLSHDSVIWPLHLIRIPQIVGVFSMIQGIARSGRRMRLRKKE